MLTNVTKDSGYFYATDEDGNRVVIEESISFLFLLSKDGKKKLSYSAITYRNHLHILEQIQDMLTGATFETGILDRVYIRYGWMDKQLNSLRFRCVLDFIREFRDGSISKADNLKVKQLCKQLSLSIRGLPRNPKV